MNLSVVCVFVGVVFGRSLSGKWDVIDTDSINFIKTCRLNNCTEVEYTGDLGAAQKGGWKIRENTPRYSSSGGSNFGGWSRRGLLISEEQQQVGCVSQEEDVDLYIMQQSLPPCCEEFQADKDLESVCEIADKFELNCDFFMQFNDVKEQYVTSGTVFQVC